MTTTYIIVLCLVGLALSYELRFTEATRSMGRALSGSGSRNGFQDSITPPAHNSLAFGIWGLSFIVNAFAFYQYGFLIGLLALFVFYVVGLLSLTFLLPKADSPHFRNIITKSMIGRYANYLRDGDKLRAGAMADLLRRAGVPIDELTHLWKG